MTTVMLPAPTVVQGLDDEFSSPTLTLEEQCALFTKALAERSESLLYQCIEWLASLKRLDPVTYVRKKIELKTAFGPSFNLRDFLSVLQAEFRRQEQAIRKPKPDIAVVAIEWAKTHRDSWAYDIESHTWYIWATTHWLRLEEEAGKPSALDHEAIDALHVIGLAVNSTQALNCFRRVAANYCKRHFPDDASKINFANGTLLLATQQLQPHKRDDNLTYCLNYHYDPKGTHPEITTYLEHTIPDEHARQAVIAHIGLSLMRDITFHNFGLMIGPPRGGKSTALALMNAVCGLIDDPYRFAGPSLFTRDLEGKRSRAIWVDHRAVCVDELPGEALREEELLKLMSAHSGVEMRRIGKDERTDNRWKPKLLMSTNDTPHYKDTSGAIRHRAIIIECPNGPIPDNQQDKNLFNDKLLPEIGAFAATCLRYALALKQRGYYPRSVQMRKTLDEIEHSGNPLKAFIRECCILEPGAKITSDQLHKAYAEYVTDGGNSPMAKNKMSSSIRDMRIGVSVGEWMRWNSRPTRCLKGIRLRNEFDGDPDEPEYQDDPFLIPPLHTQVMVNQGPLKPAATEMQQTEGETPPNKHVRDTIPLDYPECMSYNMEPPPETPCSVCGTTAYTPYWGTMATKKWGCSTCHPHIVEKLGLYNIENLQRE